MIYGLWSLPEPWKLILCSLEERPKRYDELLDLGIKKDKLKEILSSMVKLNMIQESRGSRYSLKHKEVRLKC